MTQRWDMQRVLALLDNDEELLSYARRAQLFTYHPEGISEEDVETLRVLRVLVRELEVNWAGAEVALRLRDELLATQRQLHELLAILSSRPG